MPETTLSAVALPPSDAIAYFRQKVNVPTEHWADLRGEAHARAFAVAGAASDALLRDLRTAVERALTHGNTEAEFRKDFDAIVKRYGWDHTGKPGWRAGIIYQTNVSVAYSAGQYRQMTTPEHTEMFPFWRYQHNHPARPRPQHLAWDGTVLECTDPWWSTHWPPNGWRCQCSVEPMSDRDMRRAGRSGPDQAPPVDLRPWKNPKTGEIIDVPHGIDPGFGHNPGQRWLDGEAGARAAHGESPTRRPMPPAQDAGPAQPPTRPRPEHAPEPLAPADRAPLHEPAPVRHPTPAAHHLPPPAPIARDARAWIDQQLQDREADGTARVIGNIPPQALEALADTHDLPETAAITLTSRALQHMARDNKAAAGKSLSLAALRLLPRLLAAPRAVLRERGNGNLLIVFDGGADDRLGKLVIRISARTRVRVAGSRSTVTANTVLTAGVVDAHQLKRETEYEVLSGTM